MSHVRHLLLQRKLTLMTTENGLISGQPKVRKAQYMGSFGISPIMVILERATRLMIIETGHLLHSGMGLHG